MPHKIRQRWMKVHQFEGEAMGTRYRLTLEFPFDWWWAIGGKLKNIRRAKWKRSHG